MEDIAALIEFIDWLIQSTLFTAGLLLGIVGTLVAIPVSFRIHRRAVLRRRWKADKPRKITEGLFPEWQDYDPEIPGIARRCVCHGRRIHPGERVLTWPETGPMHLLHVAVYCETVKERLWDGQ